MTQQQRETLRFAGFTKNQVAALEAVFTILPSPERRAEIDTFVKETVGGLKEIGRSMDAKRKISEAKARTRQELLRRRLLRNPSLTDLTDKPEPPTP